MQEEIVMSGYSSGELNSKIEKFNRKRVEGEIDVVLKLRELLDNTGKNSNFSLEFMYLQDPDVIKAKDLNPDSQIAILNKYFYKHLIVFDDSYQVRTNLVTGMKPESWLALMSNTVVPYFVDKLSA